MPANLRSLLPGAAWARFLLAPAVVFIATALDRNYQTDFWHHLSRGRAIAEQGQLVNRDLFTYTVHDQPFQDSNWLSQLCYYRLYEVGGLGLVQCVNSLTLAAMMGVVVWLCRRRCGSVLVAAGLGIFTFFGLWQLLIIRPQTFSLLLFVLLYAVLDLAEGPLVATDAAEPGSPRRRFWLLLAPPAIMALWVNLHGGFTIGLILIGCFLLAAAWDSALRHRLGVLRDGRVWALGLCLAASVAATSANPYGWKVYEYVRVTSSAAAARRIDEWVPPGLDLLVGKVWVLSVLLLVVLFALPRRRPSAREVFLVLCFLPLACGSVRMVAWWLLISAPIAAGLLAANLPRNALVSPEAEPPTLASGAFAVLVLLACVAGGLSLAGGDNSLLAAVRPAHRDEDDLEEVVQHLPPADGGGRIFSRFEWGEYLGWELEPRGYTVFMDGRIEIFPDDVWDRYAAVTKGRADWETILDGYHVDCLLLDSSYHADLLPQVERSADWEKTFQAGKAVLFVRRPGKDATAQVSRGPAAGER
jgi:hypothetical protein